MIIVALTVALIIGISFSIMRAQNQSLKIDIEYLEGLLSDAKLYEKSQQETIEALERLLDSKKRNDDLGKKLMQFGVKIMKASGIEIDEDEFDISPKEENLEEQLRQAEAAQDFEEAARLRDLINKKNTK